MLFSVTILGSNSALPLSERNPSAQVLSVSERIFLIDCGEGTQLQMRRFNVNFSRINHIFISHLHGDHVFGLMGLISTFGLLNRKVDLHIYAHEELEKLLTPHINFFCTDLSYKVVFHHLNHKEKEVVLDDKHITVESFPLSHRVPACGFLFKEKPKLPNIRKEAISKYNLSISEIVRIKNGDDLIDESGHLVPNYELVLPPPPPRSYAYCSDTKYTGRTAGYVKGVSLLYHESTFSEEMRKLAKTTGHSTAAQAAKVAVDAGAKKLLLGHFSSRFRDISVFENEARQVFPNSVAVTDGAVYEVE